MDFGHFAVKAAQHVFQSLTVGVAGALFGTLMATLLIVRLRGAKTMRQALIMGVAAGCVVGAVMGIVALFA
jgi:hypothetical protein